MVMFIINADCLGFPKYTISKGAPFAYVTCLI